MMIYPSPFHPQSIGQHQFSAPGKSGKWLLLSLLFILLTLPGCSSLPEKQDDPLGLGIEELFSFLGENDRVRVAVLPLVDVPTEKEDELGAYLASDIIYQISSRPNGRVLVVERERIALLMQELELNTLSGVISESDVKRMGELSGADILLLGTKLELDEEIQTGLRLVDVESGEVRGAVKIKLPRSSEYASFSSSSQGSSQGSESGPAVASTDRTEAPVTGTAFSAGQEIAADLILSGSGHFPINDKMKAGFSSKLGSIIHFAGKPFYLDAGITYSRADTAGMVTDGPLSILGFSAGGGLELKDHLPVDLRLGGRLGYGLANLEQGGETSSAGALYWTTGAGVEIPLGDKFGINLEAGITTQTATYMAVETGIGFVVKDLFLSEKPKSTVNTESYDQVSPTEPDEPKPALKVTRSVEYTKGDLHLVDTGFALVFPVFYRYYNSNPIGMATLRNTGSDDIEDISVTVNIPRFMDLPQGQKTASVLGPGKETTFDLMVLFNDELLRVTEGTQVAAEITVSYTRKNEVQSYSLNTVIDVANRNAMTWDDDRKAASFVTARDPSLLAYARTVAGITGSDGKDMINKNIRTAMALFEAFHASGLSYVIDPVTPYTELAGSDGVDFLLFPVQTFQYGGGDCDDLSIAYTAALESVGIESAFITIPGHIFAAFNTGIPESEWKTVSSRQSEVIIHEGKIWIPVEVTILERGFMEAWATGAREWNNFEKENHSNLLIIREAWKLFEPIGLDRETRQTIEVPNLENLSQQYRQELDIFIDSVVDPEVALLLEKINTDGPSQVLYNRLGVLYARYGIYDEALVWLTKATAIGSGHQPFLNMGHIAFLEGDYSQAVSWYKKAETLAPGKATILLALARVEYEMGNQKTVLKYYGMIEEINPALAEKYSYLAGITKEEGRASEGDKRADTLPWELEEEF
jgi:TolB-like protein